MRRRIGTARSLVDTSSDNRPIPIYNQRCDRNVLTRPNEQLQCLPHGRFIGIRELHRDADSDFFDCRHNLGERILRVTKQQRGLRLKEQFVFDTGKSGTH